MFRLKDRDRLTKASSAGRANPVPPGLTAHRMSSRNWAAVPTLQMPDHSDWTKSATRLGHRPVPCPWSGGGGAHPILTLEILWRRELCFFAARHRNSRQSVA